MQAFRSRGVLIFILSMIGRGHTVLPITGSIDFYSFSDWLMKTTTPTRFSASATSISPLGGARQG